MQALHENGKMVAGARGLGFGCGAEPIPSYLAARDINVTITDLPPSESAHRGWANTNQWTESLETAFHAHLVTRDQFDRNASLRFVDMNAIPDDLNGYDFCWSLCALEHLGSIQKGLDFIGNSLRVLKPGGVAVHTTEFNFFNDKETIDNWGTVLFQKAHFETLAASLRREGHEVAPLDFDVGRKPLDRFIDIPPYTQNWNDDMQTWWGGDERHIKLSIDGFPSTCFGMIVRKTK